MINSKELTTIGLSEKESQVYLYLLTNGESKTGEICKHTKIPSSHIYTLLNTLLEKGLATYKVINNIKTFSAVPEILEQLFVEQEKRLSEQKNMLAQLVRLQKINSVDRRADFKYFKGTQGIKSLYAEVINSWRKGDEYCIASAPRESFTKLEGFFLEVVHKKRLTDQVQLKIIVNKNSKEWGNLRKKMPLTQVRYLNLETETEYGVLNNYFFLINYGVEPYGLLIKDTAFANTYKTFFEILWNQAKE